MSLVTTRMPVPSLKRGEDEHFGQIRLPAQALWNVFPQERHFLWAGSCRLSILVPYVFTIVYLGAKAGNIPNEVLLDNKRPRNQRDS